MTKRIELDPDDRTVKPLIEGEVVPDELHWKMAERSEARHGEEESYTSVTSNSLHTTTDYPVAADSKTIPSAG